MRNLFATLAAALVAFSIPLCFSLSMQGQPLWTRFNPLDAIDTLAFAMGWGLGVPTPLALLLAVALYLLPPALAFFAVRRWYRPDRGAGRAR